MYSSHYTEAESLCVDTQWLKGHGYFSGYKAGGITWTWPLGDKSSIGFTVNTMDKPTKMQLKYTVTHYWNDEQTEMDYTVPLIKVPCKLGGYRWAFKCELSKNSAYCGRTVYKLYKPPNSDYFGFIKCMHIIYESQRISGSAFEWLGKIIKAENEYDELYKTIHKWHYQGKSTKKVLKLKLLESRIHRNNLGFLVDNSF